MVDVRIRSEYNQMSRNNSASNELLGAKTIKLSL